MSTLGTLKTRILDDFEVPRIGRTGQEVPSVRVNINQVGDAITDAIEHYKTTRFWFNETRTATFATVADQSIYTVSDDADIPLFVEIDVVFLNDGSNENELVYATPAEIQNLLDSSASSGEPSRWSYFESSFRLYPVPDAAYTVRPIGLIEKAAPSTDGEASNVWMVNAFELIRCRAKLYLAIHAQMDERTIRTMDAAERSAYRKLRGETTKKQSGGLIQATAF